MPDPFRSNLKSQLIREAQIGLSVIAILLTLFVYVAFYKLTGRGHHLPEHVRNAPVAETIWPGTTSSHENKMSRRELPDVRRSGLSQQKRESDSERRLPSRQPEMLDARSSVARSNPAKLPGSRNRSVPRTTITKIGKSPGFGEQLKTLLGGFASDRDNVPDRTDSNPVASRSAVAAATTPSIPFSGGSTAIEVGDSEAWIPPLSPTESTDEASDSVPDVQLTSAETTGNDFVPAVKIETVSSQAKTTASEFSSSGDFNLNSDFQIEKRQNQPVLETNSDPAIPSASDLDTADVVASAISDLDAEDGNCSENAPGLKLIAPKPFTSSNAQTIQRQLPRPEVRPTAGNVWPAERVSPKKTYSGIPLSVDAEANSDNAPHQSLTYIVREGDSFWSIAQSIYGDGRFFRALYKYNEATVPQFDSLIAGTKIGTPFKDDLAKIWPDLCPGGDCDQVVVDANRSDAADRIYVTKAGDTLFEIARQKLGQASRYLEIKQMNDVRLDEHADHLSPLRQGVRLVLPAQ